MIGTDDFGDSTRLVLVNAIYFKGVWAMPFEKRNTKRGFFFTDQRQKVEVDFMNKTEVFSYARLHDLDAQIIELPYQVSIYTIN